MNTLSAAPFRALGLSAASVLALLPFVACSGSGGTAPVTVGGSGGVIEFDTGDLAGFRLEVPPEALSQLGGLRIALAPEFPLPAGFVPLGPAVSLFEDLNLSANASARLPIDQVILALSRTIDVLVVDRNGIEYGITGVDQMSAGVWFEVRDGGVYRPVIRASARLSTAELLPLLAPARLEFEQGVTLNVGPETIPPAQRPLPLRSRTYSILSVERPGLEPFDFLLRREPFGGTTWVGRFDRDFGQLLVAEREVLFADEGELPGRPRAVRVDSSAWNFPIGFPPQNLGVVDELLEIEWLPVGDVTTPAGVFPDCVELSIEEIGGFRGGFDPWVLTLAPNVGPIRLQRPAVGLDSRFVSGVVDGNPVTAPLR